MIKIFTTTNHSFSEITQRTAVATPQIQETVAAIIHQVQQKGDAALLELTENFDGLVLQQLRVPDSEIEEALQQLDPELLGAMTRSLENIRSFHQKQVRQGFITTGDGTVLGQRILPLEKVGVYVPGGTAAYPSTVLMDVIPAQVAGVKRIVMVTPPNKAGKVNPVILAAAKLAGVTEVYQVGGAQAVAALAYGTETIPQVDKIVGPGNIYVAAAKKQVYGTVDIDMIAGPSDVLIIADETAQADWLAADLLAQAEHDNNAQAILVTPNATLATQVQEVLKDQLDKLPRKPIASVSIENNGKIIVTKDLEEAVVLANQIAPEHLELAIAEPFAWLGKIKNAGSVFLGHHTAEVLGDYYAGPNHTLPTEGTSRFYSALSVDDFVKRSSYLYYSEEALKKAAKDVMTFAKAEGLEGHARSIAIRLEE